MTDLGTPVVYKTPNCNLVYKLRTANSHLRAHTDYWKCGEIASIFFFVAKKLQVFSYQKNLTTTVLLFFVGDYYACHNHYNCGGRPFACLVGRVVSRLLTRQRKSSKRGSSVIYEGDQKTTERNNGAKEKVRDMPAGEGLVLHVVRVALPLFYCPIPTKTPFGAR